MKKKLVAGLLSALLFMMSACGATDQPPVATEEPEVEISAEEETTEEETTEEVAEEASRLQPEWTKDAVIYEVNVRQYTEEGTFAAFGEHLQELKDMGVNVLWFMPIHPISKVKRSGVLGSYYSVADYCDVNPEFGTLEDFGALVEKAHGMGFHVMLDWVANHTGWDNPWITEHPDWYTQDAQGNIISPEGMGWPDVADLNFDSAEMRAEMIESMKFWVENYDIDGFRCDYASGVPVDFWEEARVALDEVKPMYMLAEDNLVKALLLNAFDMNYNWDLYEDLIHVVQGGQQASSLKNDIPTRYPDGTYTLNFLDNHDKNSYEHTIMGAFGADALPQLFAFIYTIPGVPLVYSGDEIGLDHAIEFMSKDPIDWESSEYDYRELLARLSQIRSENPALYAGNYGGQITYYNLGNKSVFAFSREKNSEETGANIVKCVYNMSKTEQTIDVSELITGNETVLLSGIGSESITLEECAVSDTELAGEVTLKPWEFWVLSE